MIGTHFGKQFSKVRKLTCRNMQWGNNLKNQFVWQFPRKGKTLKVASMFWIKYKSIQLILKPFHPRKPYFVVA